MPKPFNVFDDFADFKEPAPAGLIAGDDPFVSPAVEGVFWDWDDLEVH